MEINNVKQQIKETSKPSMPGRRGRMTTQENMQLNKQGRQFCAAGISVRHPTTILNSFSISSSCFVSPWIILSSRASFPIPISSKFHSQCPIPHTTHHRASSKSNLWVLLLVSETIKTTKKLNLLETVQLSKHGNQFSTRCVFNMYLWNAPYKNPHCHDNLLFSFSLPFNNPFIKSFKGFQLSL